MHASIAEREQFRSLRLQSYDNFLKQQYSFDSLTLIFEHLVAFWHKIPNQSYPMVPCCPCVSVRRNQGRLTKSLNEGTHLFLRQNAVA